MNRIKFQRKLLHQVHIHRIVKHELLPKKDQIKNKVRVMKTGENEWAFIGLKPQFSIPDLNAGIIISEIK